MMRFSMTTDENESSSSSEDEKADKGCLQVEVKIKCSGKKKKAALQSPKKGSGGKDLKQQETAIIKDSPIEQVRLVVPTTDDPTIPSFTFRVLTLGLFFCVILSIVDNLFSVRQNPIGISSMVVTLISLPMGQFMAAKLPERVMRIPGIGYEFTFNPGPFSLKEHVLLVVVATTGVGNMTSNIIAILKTTFDIMLDPIPMLLLSLTIVFLGYGIAGLFTSLLVDSPYMWWPYNLVTVTFYRALHEKEKRPKGGLTRLQFFVVVSALSCAYYVVPNFFFPSITALSFICWIYKDSVLAQLLGSGLHGFGFGAIAFDWSTVTAYLGSPLCLPTHVIVNSFAGFFILFYIVCPIAYWKNAFSSQSFPYFSSDIYDKFGQPYNLTRILKTDSLELDVSAYKEYSNLYSGIVFALSYGFIFASITAGLSQVLLFNGKELWDQLTMMFNDADKGDIHNVLMDKYEKIPKWWYFVILVPTLAVSFYTIEGFGGQLQLRYWGLLLALLLVFIFVIPIGFIQATTGQGIGLDTLAQILIGYIDPGKPISNKVFESYVTSTMGSILGTLSDLKLAHYLKIPPKDMMLAQIIGSFFGATLTFLVTWWMFMSIENICHPELLPPGSPWTCPYITMMSSITAMYGLVGPSYVFFPHGVYSSMFIFFIVGALAPIPLWLLACAYPEKEWIQKINLPIIFTAGAYIPPATAMHYWIWFFVGIFFSHYVYKYHKRWWAKNVFILSIGLDTGVAVMALVASVTVNVANIYGIRWWGLELDDHCPLAKCPIATGVEVGGCPKY